MIALNGVTHERIAFNGQVAKTALSAANDVLAKGVYDPTTLSTVDADLAVGNIKSGVTIFGFTGTLVGGVETIGKYSDGVLATGASYTPADPGIFSFITGGASTIGFSPYYYSTLAGLWYAAISVTGGNTVGMGIGDGANFKIQNNNAADREYILMRHHLSTGTYERVVDENLVGGGTYTPATSGFFADGQAAITIRLEFNLTTAAWSSAIQGAASGPVAIVIGDGTNLRVKNTTGGALYHVLMRAKMTP